MQSSGDESNCPTACLFVVSCHVVWMHSQLDDRWKMHTAARSLMDGTESDSVNVNNGQGFVSEGFFYPRDAQTRPYCAPSHNPPVRVFEKCTTTHTTSTI